MATVYLRGRDHHKPDDKRFYYITYSDQYGRRREVKGCIEESKTRKLAKEIDLEVALIRRGLVDPEQVRLTEKRR